MHLIEAYESSFTQEHDGRYVCGFCGAHVLRGSMMGTVHQGHFLQCIQPILQRSLDLSSFWVEAQRQLQILQAREREQFPDLSLQPLYLAQVEHVEAERKRCPSRLQSVFFLTDLRDRVKSLRYHLQYVQALWEDREVVGRATMTADIHIEYQSAGDFIIVNQAGSLLFAHTGSKEVMQQVLQMLQDIFST